MIEAREIPGPSPDMDAPTIRLANPSVMISYWSEDSDQH